MSKNTILIVDDDELITEEFESLFQEEGYNVILAYNGQEGLDAFEKNEKIDFVLSDIKMPVMDGVEFIKNLKSIGNSVPFIFMTGYSDYTEEDLLSLGVNAVLFKPFDVEALLNTVAGMLRI